MSQLWIKQFTIRLALLGGTTLTLEVHWYSFKEASSIISKFMGSQIDGFFSFQLMAAECFNDKQEDNFCKFL